MREIFTDDDLRGNVEVFSVEKAEKQFERYMQSKPKCILKDNEDFEGMVDLVVKGSEFVLETFPDEFSARIWAETNQLPIVGE
jgi:predicted ATP-grasp superfamily ATP-dependent carboligase